MANSPTLHVPVLQEDVLFILAPRSGDTVLDATVGLGGHARAFLEHIEPTGQLIGVDADEKNIIETARNLASWKNCIHLIHGNFRNLQHLLTQCTSVPSVPSHHLGPLPHIDILFVDLGLSSPHIDDPLRGFTFRSTAPLDLRFDRTRGIPVSTFLQSTGEKDLAAIFTMYGELPRSNHLASLIVAAPPMTTTELKTIAEHVYKWRAPRFLPQVFQALRIAVNDELSALGDLLRDGPELLAPFGRMGILCYHSLEDRMVKQEFRRRSTPEKDPITGKVCTSAPFRLLTPKVIRPTLEECARNPRSRSARFRAIERIAPSPPCP